MSFEDVDHVIFLDLDSISIGDYLLCHKFIFRYFHICVFC